MRYPGWPLSITKDIPKNVIKYVSKQINVEPEGYLQYGQREATAQQHMDEIRQEYGYKSFTKAINKELFEGILKYAIENVNSVFLIHSAISELRKNKVILPAMTTIELCVWEARKTAEEEIFRIINDCITTEQMQKLNELLDSKVERINH